MSFKNIFKVALSTSVLKFRLNVKGSPTPSKLSGTDDTLILADVSAFSSSHKMSF